MNDLKRTEEFMRDMAGAIHKAIDVFCPGKLFALLIFESGKPGLGNYISNAERSNMIKSLRETADRLEKNEDISAVVGEA